MPTTDTQVQELIINQLTEAEYNAAVQAGTINENELYMVTDVQYPTMNDLNGYQPLINSSNKLSSSLVSGLSSVATSGDYNDLTNKPTLSSVAISGEYSDLLNKPTLSNVATSGDYNDLTNKPTWTYNAQTETLTLG